MTHWEEERAWEATQCAARCALQREEDGRERERKQRGRYQTLARGGRAPRGCMFVTVTRRVARIVPRRYVTLEGAGLELWTWSAYRRWSRRGKDAAAGRVACDADGASAELARLFVLSHIATCSHLPRSRRTYTLLHSETPLTTERM
jgi:hypothetical protein